MVENTEENLNINPWLCCLPTMAAAFMFVLDETIANVALPHMAGSFSVSREESMWILTSYLIASGIVIPMVGWFSKVLGRKNFFIISIIVFTVASALCGLAQNMEMMVFSRILQGIGGGGLLPISQAILFENFKPEERGKAMAMFGFVIVIAPIIGPVIGGWITENWSWPFIYYINIPIGILAVWLCKIFIYDPPYARKQTGVKTDGLGFFFLTIWLVTLQIVLDKGNNADWFNATWICWLSAISCVAGVAFLYSQIKNKESLVDLSVFRDKNFLLGTLVQIVMQAVLLASLAILPQFLQSLMGYDAYKSGLSMMPRGLGSLMAMVLCAMLANIVDNRFLVMIGFGCLAAGSWMLGDLNLEFSTMNIAIPNFLFGMGLGLTMIPIITLSVATLKNEQMTNASGLQNLLKNIGGAFGTSIVATLISRGAQKHQYMLINHLTDTYQPFVERVQAMAGAFSSSVDPFTANYMGQGMVYQILQQQANLSAFIDAFRIFAIASVATIPLILLLNNIKKEEHN
ncbi:MAG: DHA2 family efflux MFS transporter permease subunit [Candidatus Gastranaerophilales bacterium]|nr:DHA2 family efflux MFS transporter permease subunit [Candidatus Gastranaerophilales bacterium]MCM1072660.1 DHA2 family efflux MFS transporter permease subunit [Bacteroides sp.]